MALQIAAERRQQKQRFQTSRRGKYLSPTGESSSAPSPSVVVYMGSNIMAFADAFASLGDIYVRWQHGDA